MYEYPDYLKFIQTHYLRIGYLKLAYHSNWKYIFIDIFRNVCDRNVW